MSESSCYGAILRAEVNKLRLADWPRALSPFLNRGNRSVEALTSSSEIDIARLTAPRPDSGLDDHDGDNQRNERISPPHPEERVRAEPDKNGKG